MSVRLAVASLDDELVGIDGSDHHYLFRVLRLAQGDTITLFDGRGTQAKAVIETVTATSADLRITERSQEPPASRPHLTVLLPLIKGDRMERCISQLVELGLDRLVVYDAARAVVQLSAQRMDSRIERYRKVATAAARQARRSVIPTINGVVPLADALGIGGEGLILWEREKTTSLLGQLPTAPPTNLTVLSGPEGGFTDQELELVRDAGFRFVGLGPLTLRADTAPVAAIAAIRQHYATIATAPHHR